MTSYLWRPVPLLNHQGMLGIFAAAEHILGQLHFDPHWASTNYLQMDTPAIQVSILSLNSSCGWMEIRSAEQERNQTNRLKTVNLWGNFSPAQPSEMSSLKSKVFVGGFFFPPLSKQRDSGLSAWVSGLPEETRVDFVPCLKAFALCGFLTCQSAILRSCDESYWLGDGPPRI